MALSEDLTDELIEETVEIERASENTKEELLLILAALLKSIVDQVIRIDPISAVRRQTRDARTKELFDTVRKDIRDAYHEIYKKLAADLRELSTIEARRFASRLNEIVGRAVVTDRIGTAVARSLAAEILIDGTPLRAWIGRHAGDLLFRFEAEVRRSVEAEETAADLVQRLRGTAEARFRDGITQQSRRHLEALVRTAFAAAAGAVRLETLKENDGEIVGYFQLSILDGVTSQICRAYAFKRWDTELRPVGHDLPFNGGTPRHFYCRSSILPIFRGTEPPPQDTFTRWINSKPASFQDKLFGKGKASLWRDGKITQSDLVDQSGRALSLAEIQKQVGS